MASDEHYLHVVKQGKHVPLPLGEYPLIQRVHTEAEEQAKQLLGHPLTQTFELLKLYPYGQVKHWVRFVELHVRQFDEEVHLLQVLVLESRYAFA